MAPDWKLTRTNKTMSVKNLQRVAHPHRNWRLVLGGFRNSAQPPTWLLDTFVPCFIRALCWWHMYLTAATASGDVLFQAPCIDYIYLLIYLLSGVTRIGVTRGGNWGRHSYFCSSLSLLLISLGCHPPGRCHRAPYLPVRPRLSPNLCKFTYIFFVRVSPPGGCHPGRSTHRT